MRFQTLPSLVTSAIWTAFTAHALVAATAQDGIFSRGSAPELPSEALHYLDAYGYLNSTYNVTAALEALQTWNNIPVSGIYDSKTREIVSTPRCGNPDITPGPDAPSSKRFLLNTIKGWRNTPVRYRMDTLTHKVPLSDAVAAVRLAFSKWARASRLRFSEVAQGTPAEIVIRCGPYDGQGHTLGVTFLTGGDDYLSSADVLFDSVEDWTARTFHDVALHEFGHALGISHTDKTRDEVVMWPTYKGFSEPDDAVWLELRSDDIAAIQAIYGPAAWRSGTGFGQGGVGPGSSIATVKRTPRWVHVFYITDRGAVREALYQDGNYLDTREVAAVGSAQVGTIAAVSRLANALDVFWIGPDGSVQSAYWYEENNQWRRTTVSGPGSAALNSKLAATSRAPISTQVFWITPAGAVKIGWFSQGQVTSWILTGLAPDGSAQTDRGAVTALNRGDGILHVFWANPAGGISEANMVKGYFALAPDPVVVVASGVRVRAPAIVSLTHIDTAVELFFIDTTGTVKHAHWQEGGSSGWQIDPITRPNTGQYAISAASRRPGSLETWWSTSDGSIRQVTYDSRWPTNPWQEHEVAPAGTARTTAGDSSLAGVSRQDNSYDLFFQTPDGGVGNRYWYEY